MNASRQVRSRDGLCVLEGIVDRLRGTGKAFSHSPSVIVVAKFDNGFVLHIAGIKRSADFIQWSPSPDKLNVSRVALLGDSGNADEFPSRRWNREGGFGGLVRGNGDMNCVYAGGREQNVPAGWRRQALRTRGGIDRYPAAMLKHEIFGGQVVFVGNDARLQHELLGSFEYV